MRRASLVATLAVLAACGREPSPPVAPAPPPAAPSAAPPAPATRPAERTARELDWGEPDMTKVKKLFQRRFPEVKHCYEAALARDETASGRLVLRFTILETGALSGVAATRSTFRRGDVPACIADVVRGWRTPFRPAEPVEVEYPLRFSPR